MTPVSERPLTASYVILRREDGKVAFVLRSNVDWMSGYYGLPSGKVDPGETFLAAAVREVAEEVGVQVEVTALRHLLTVHRREPGEAESWVDIYFEAHVWQGEVYNAEPDRHSAVEWFVPAELPANTIPSVVASFEAIAASDTYFEYSG